ncbi:glycoside hydrolase family 2 protein [Ramlibacter sp. AW1]|uniref:beta-mannosidase n=1 Tax=Ramlibacter aurantiacus TaxID=2801330 RepID=A0A937D4Y1_9BURK|nr:glycoside hydrolase family 2 protein [Ramlibacter aurantiacus]MBL0419348.1 glycoside hydrolase family 2 protein [Ramlibacter aurantiacus]
MRAIWQCGATEPGAPPPADAAEWVAMDGPGTAAAALRAHGLWSLDAPPRDFDAQDWWFLARFDAPHDAVQVLGCDGLATLAEVSLNGQALFASDNMFTRHRHALPPGVLRPRDNELRIHCRSLGAALRQRRPRPNWRAPMVPDTQLRWFRTTLLGRTPGWSPPAAAVGPWREVWLRATHEIPIEHRLQARLEGGHGVCELDGPASEWPAGTESPRLVLQGPDGQVHASDVRASDGRFAARLDVPRPALWWPHTHGEPALYEATLELRLHRGGTARHALGRVGFRDLQVDTAGGRFALRVNGEAVFCRGAGWFPLDAVSLRSETRACRGTLLRMREAGLNMLRLPGTGVYEDDAFYAQCDELGLMVWQDFMFASMDYPFDDAGFAASSEREVRQQLRRLAPHPCLAVLCGNSEVEQQAAMWGAARELWQPRFFHEQLPAECRELAPGVPYWPSSAHGGAFPHQADAGTTSYYGVGAYERPLADAVASGLGFATECLAFAAVPSNETLARLPGGASTRVHHPAWKSRTPRDLGAGWDFDDVRDHYVRELCGVEPARLRHADHERYLELGRLAVAEAMGHAYGSWRRADARCGGALLLQLRDFWPAAGWGVLDDQGRAKSGWHALRRALQPTGLHLSDEGANGPVAHLVNETAQPVQAVLEFTAWRDGEVRVASAEQPLTMEPRSRRSVPLLGLMDHFMDLNHFWRFGPPACDVLHARLRAAGADAPPLAEAFLFPLGLAPLLANRRALDLRATVTAMNDEQAELELQTRAAAIGVHLDLPGWEAVDDHLHLAPGSTRRIELHRVRAGAALAGTVAALNGPGPVPLEKRA